MNRAISRSQLTLQSAQTANPIFPNLELTYKPPQLNVPLFTLSNASITLPSSNVFVDTKNFTTMRWNVDNRDSSGDIFAFLYGSDKPVDDIDTLITTKLVRQGNLYSERLPLVNQYVKTEYVSLADFQSNVKVDVNFEQFAQMDVAHQEFKAVSTYDFANYTKIVNDYKLDIIREKFFNIEDINLNAHISQLYSNNEQLAWDYDDNYTKLSTAQTLKLESDNAADSSYRILIKGLDNSGTDIQEFISLDGTDATTPVNTVNTYLKVNSLEMASQTDSKFIPNGNIGTILCYYLNGVTKEIQDLISPQRSNSNTFKYAMSGIHTGVLKDLHISATTGNIQPTLDLIHCKSIDNGTPNIKKYTLHLDDVQGFTDTIPVDLLIRPYEEIFIRVNPNGAVSQQNYWSISANIIKYDST